MSLANNRQFWSTIDPVPAGVRRPRWSVMIPTYNCAEYLRTTLASVLAQDPGPELMQIEVVDDGSTWDDPEAVVRELGGGRVAFFRQPHNVGHVQNFDTCVRRARGEIVHILHGDDLVRPGFYERMDALFAEHHAIGAAFCRHITVDDHGTERCLSALERPDAGILEGWLERVVQDKPLQTPAIAVRRSVYERLGGFDQRIVSCGEDWEMWVRIALHYPVAYEPAVMAVHRDNGASLTKRSVRSGQNVRDMRTAASVIQSYLPPAVARISGAKKRVSWARWGLYYTDLMLAEGNIAAARVQLTEALRCSRDPEVLQQALPMATRLAGQLARRPARKVAHLLHRARNLTAPVPSETPSPAPLAVLDLEATQLPERLQVPERYRGALALLRVHGQPAGQSLLPVVGGYVGGDDLRGNLFLGADAAFWEAWLQAELGWRPEPINPAGLPRATVAVCTRDRTDDLRRCLDALMALPDDGQEFVIIDNAPATDATRELVQAYPRVRYVREDRPGLDNARNRALRETRTEVVAFTDDDAAPDRLWLRTLLRHFRDDPAVMCVTGLTMALELETEAQEKFQRSGGFTRGFKPITFDPAVNNPHLGWQAGAGVNMAYRRSVVEQVGPFDPALDVGTPTRGGGDSDMFRRVLEAGYKIVYDPTALNWHKHRRSIAELERQMFGYEVAGFAIWTRALLFEHNLGGLVEMGSWLRRETPALARELRRPRGSLSRTLTVARFRGASIGPAMYLYAHWRALRGK